MDGYQRIGQPERWSGAELVERTREKTSERISAAGPPLLFTPPKLNDEQQALVDRFHTFMYDITDENSFRSFFVSWLGYGMLKWPTDLWNYQEIVVQAKPDVIVETGTHRGGSALFLASICELIDRGEVISIDIDDTYRATQPKHPRLTFLNGSSTDPNIVAEVKRRIADRTNVFVILDSDHDCNHVLNELRIYSQLVPLNGYLVVEDTNVNGHPAYPEFGPGPHEAVDLFLGENSHFEVDRIQERFYLTQNPCGFLRRRSEP
jgi:cephalosporin hydroxylase